MKLSEAFDLVHSFVIEELENRERSFSAGLTDVSHVEDALKAERAVTEAREVSNELLETCKVLDRLGGLGLDKHAWLRKAIDKAEGR